MSEYEVKRPDFITNPYLPEYEYIPDGEPHVFGDRVYIYGSHDAFNARRFCANDYVCYSASVKDLKHWKYEGVIYRVSQDPRTRDGGHEFWAPDVTKGPDGKYYLYYCPDSSIYSIGVAVSDSPAGPFEYLGLVHDRNGGILGERPGDTICFDPGVFVDDDGRIYLYSGNCPWTREEMGKLPKGSRVMEMESDMVTILTEPKKLLPIFIEADGTDFEGHEFFEASSIRKYNGKYILIYSSVSMHELCYAISDRPDEGFRYGGVVISNADQMPETGDRKFNIWGNNHGGIEWIDGQPYIFYHRQTNRTMFSRQGCAEKVRIHEDGRIEQAQMTSCGLNGGPLPGVGTFSAGIAAHLHGVLPPVRSAADLVKEDHPYFTQDGPDYDPDSSTGEPPHQYITNGKDGMTAVYRFFDISKLSEIEAKVRGNGEGTLTVSAKKVVGEDERYHAVYESGEAESICLLKITPSEGWQTVKGSAQPEPGVYELVFSYSGSGAVDFMNFTLRV